jgi:phosphopantetheinyl transferase (holo-ACP synthase)
LHGKAARLAQDSGIGELALSMSHEGDTAVAVVMTLSAAATREALS